MFNCQVFYHKKGTNHWRATIAFFPKKKMKVKINLGSNAVLRLIMYCYKHRKSMNSTRMLTTVNVLIYTLKAAKLKSLLVNLLDGSVKSLQITTR